MVKAEAVEEGDSSGQCGSAETERKEDALKGDVIDPLGMVAETQTKTILVVDDDLRVLSVAEDILRSMSYSVISTIDPRVALQSARDYPGAIHLLLTDVTMPLGSGIQLAAEFRVIRPEAKVLFMSGYNVGTVEAHRLQLAPAEPFLKKPFTMDDLQSAVKAVLVYRPP